MSLFKAYLLSFNITVFQYAVLMLYSGRTTVYFGFLHSRHVPDSENKLGTEVMGCDSKSYAEPRVAVHAEQHRLSRHYPLTHRLSADMHNRVYC